MVGDRLLVALAAYMGGCLQREGDVISIKIKCSSTQLSCFWKSFSVKWSASSAQFVMVGFLSRA